MRLVFEYLEMLQDIGMYKDATIIITADHGENYVTTELEQNTNPILFIKPKGVGSDGEMAISDIYASQIDLLPTICSVYGINHDESDGLNLLDTKGEDKTRVRYHNYTVVENTIQVATLKYEIIGSSLDFNNWHSTGEYHMFGKYY
jgi:arylsulfatase A-like enzyme